MKKEIKSYEELTKCHLKHFTAIFDGEHIDGTVLVYDDHIKLHYKQLVGDGVEYSVYIDYNEDINNDYFYNLLVEIEEWQPKFGEVVECSDEQDYFDEFRRNIFLFKKDGVFHVLDREKDAIKSFNSLETDDQGYTVYKYKFIRPIEQPKLELNWEEARQIISDTKGVKAENINLKIK